MFLPTNGTSSFTEFFYDRPWVFNKIHRSEPWRPHLKQTPAPQVTPTHMTNKSCLFFFFLTTKRGNANTAVETQAVPYFALCIIKKIASSILIPKSLLWWSSEQKTQLDLQSWARPALGPVGKKYIVLSHGIVN